MSIYCKDPGVGQGQRQGCTLGLGMCRELELEFEASLCHSPLLFSVFLHSSRALRTLASSLVLMYRMEKHGLQWLSH